MPQKFMFNPKISLLYRMKLSGLMSKFPSKVYVKPENFLYGQFKKLSGLKPKYKYYA
ncbi:MAG: hypothetical protein IJU48_06325 [Synergistaceae bacterium]|nr:hypothetical protein [Synergistaceae bacterium]